MLLAVYTTTVSASHWPTNMVSNLYTGLLGIFSTSQWTTSPIPLLKGVYQGDPLSVVIFNNVMNTLVDTIAKKPPRPRLLPCLLSREDQPTPICR